MKTNEQLAEECPAYNEHSGCTHDELAQWIYAIRLEAFKDGQEYCMKWVSEQCKRNLETMAGMGSVHALILEDLVNRKTKEKDDNGTRPGRG